MITRSWFLSLATTAAVFALAGCDEQRVEPPAAGQAKLIYNSGTAGSCDCDSVSLAEGQECIVCSEPEQGVCVCTIKLKTPTSGDN